MAIRGEGAVDVHQAPDLARIASGRHRSKQLLADTVGMRAILMRTLTMVARAAAVQDIADTCRRFAPIVAGLLLGTAAVLEPRGPGTP